MKTAEQRLGPDGVLRLTGEMLTSCRDWLTQTFRSPKTHGLFAPWISHTGLGPEAALSGMMMRVFAFTLQFVGLPVPKGGGRVLVDALLSIIRDHGGECHTDMDVAQVLVDGGRARGVKLASGEKLTAKRAVIANVTPNQLYHRLLSPEQVPAQLDQAVKRFRFGPACMQINLSLKEAPRWTGDARLAQSPAVMITSGLDGVSKAWNEGTRGLLPAEPHLFVASPSVPDPSRAPAGGAVLMIQLLGLPNRPVGDAASQINVGDGTWTESLREAYADRVLKQLGRHMPNLESALIERRVTSPRDLEAVNINLVDGDPYGGSLEIAQHYLWRPMPGYPRHATHVPGLYQIGASTFPGHGLGGGSGLLVAQELLR
jgi:phytoene dehydrogenase-like protein